MEWSRYSEALFEAYASTRDNLIVQACPGAGKTTNIEHLWSMDNQPTVYLVFNKANQEEAQHKLPRKAKSAVLTLNSLGHRILLNNFGSVTLDTKKVIDIVRQTVRHGYGMPLADKREREWQLAKAIGQVKQIALTSEVSEDDYQRILSTYDLGSYPGMYHDLCKVLELSDAMMTTIDFADQIRLPAIYNLSMPHYPTILGDEVQDWSPIQAALVGKLGADRYVLVGDAHQSIYAFRGAMANSMAYLRSHFDCRQLPLSITYRCAKAIVQEAARLYPDIEPWEASPEGTVVRNWVNQHNQPVAETIDQDTLIVCRNNAPLLRYAYELLGQGIPCHVRGRDIGEGLATLVKNQDSASIGELVESLGDWYELEQQQARIREDETHIQRIDDKYHSLMTLISHCKQVDSPLVLLEHIDQVFSQGRGVTLSTVHKAKGLEAQRCYLLEHTLFDQGIARAWYDWQAEQEANAKYVAVTRAKQELVYC